MELVRFKMPSRQGASQLRDLSSPGSVFSGDQAGNETPEEGLAGVGPSQV